MKALCLAVVVSLGGAVLPTTGQGTVVFVNRAGSTILSAPIFGPEPGDPSIELHGNPPAGGILGGAPAGTQIYNGVPLQGTGYTAQLWGGPRPPEPGCDPLLQLVATASFRTGVAAGFLMTVPSAVPVPGVAAGEFASFELRVWDNQGGAITAWSQVLADPMILRGQSGIFSPSSPLGGDIIPPPYLEGLQSFNLHTVPEPGLLGLLGVGCAAVMVLRKRCR